MAVERGTQILKNLIDANLEEIRSTERINRALSVTRSTIHTGLKVSPFDLHHGKKPRTELINIVKDYKNYLSDWTTLTVSVSSKQIPIYVGRNEKGEVTDHNFKARKKDSLLHVSQVSEENGEAGERKLQYPYTFLKRKFKNSAGTEI